MILSVLLILTVAEAQQQAQLEPEPPTSGDTAARSGPVTILYHRSNVAGDGGGHERDYLVSLVSLVCKINLQGNYGHIQLDRYEECGIIR